jgi:hypothetical protein
MAASPAAATGSRRIPYSLASEGISSEPKACTSSWVDVGLPSLPAASLTELACRKDEGMSQELGFAEHVSQPAVTIRRGPSTDEARLSGETTGEEQEVATQADVVSPGNQVEDIPASHSRSLWKSVGLVITCTLAMMVNVSAYTTLQVDVCSCSPRPRHRSRALPPLQSRFLP